MGVPHRLQRLTAQPRAGLAAERPLRAGGAVPLLLRRVSALSRLRTARPDAAHDGGSGRLQGALAEYMRLGGVPELFKHPELPLARTLYDDVLYRDIATRHRIEDVRPLKELAFYLMSNPAGLVSFNKLKEQLWLGSVNTVKNYIKHLENSWPIFTTAAELKPKPGTNRFSVSQCSADRKVLENLRKRSYELRLQVAPMVC